MTPKTWLMSLLLGAASAPVAGAAPAPASCPREGLAAYTGRYDTAAFSPEGDVAIAVREGRLTFGPALWNPPRILAPTGPDLFQMEDRSERTFRFERDAAGCVTAFVTTGMPYDAPLHRLPPGGETAIGLARKGQARAAVARLRRNGRGAEEVVALGQRMLTVPSEMAHALALLREAHRRLPASAALEAALGDALVAAGQKTAAVTRYRAALRLDPTGEGPRIALERLGAAPPAPLVPVWTVPFATDALFRPPSPAEVEGVWAEWQARRLEAADVQVMATRRLTFGEVAMEARLLRHRVHGRQHYGLVLTPRDARPGCCPVIAEAKGVSWNYFPLRVPGGLNLPGILGPDLAKFVLVVPGYRGETIVWDDETNVSEGDPRDPWDGATDDLLALLNAALTVTPAADASRMGVFGRSRGGTVALLAGLRDPRLRAVAAWAAPTDHFRLMTRGGWTKEEEVRVALHRGALPREDGGQFIDQFLRPAIDGGAPLEAMRRKLLASSPLYFAERLPATQVHYGLEDSIVPAANGRALVKRLPATRPAACFDGHWYAEAGHDQDLFEAPRTTRAFLLAQLLPAAPPLDCRSAR
jgi:hypothetical protein